MLDKDKNLPHTPKEGEKEMADDDDFLRNNNLREAVLKTFEKYLECYDDKEDISENFPETFTDNMINIQSEIGELLPITQEEVEMVTHHLVCGFDPMPDDGTPPTIPKEYSDLVEEALRRYKEQQR